MKKIELLSLSVAAAALIMTTGCSDDDDAVAAAGPSAPSEVTAAMDINYTSIRNAMYVLNNMGDNGMPAPMLVSIPDEDTGSGHEQGSYTYDCEVSGSYTDTYTYSWSGVDDAQHNGDYGVSWSWTDTETTTYNDCVQFYPWTNNYNGDPMTHQTRTGSESQKTTNAYNLDTNTSTQKHVWSDNTSTSYEDNESSASKAYTYNTQRTRTSQWQGDSYRDNLADGATYRFEDVRNGHETREDTNTTGDLIYGDKTEKGNFSQLHTGTENETHTFTGNGFTASYDLNATSGEWELDGSKSYKNFVIAETTDGNNENNITISGTFGNSCLGGSVKFATSPVVQSNEVDYSDATGATGNSVLPYAGTLNLVGTTTATVVFDANETNNTSAVITIDDTNETAGSWNELAISNCVN